MDEGAVGRREGVMGDGGDDEYLQKTGGGGI
jgi:hypothetical protein